jgi:hypothetical protein
MADYTIHYIITLGRFDISKTLSAQLVDTTGADVGAAVVPTHIGEGRYYATMTVPPKHSGAIVVTDIDSNVVQATAINPQEWLGVGGGLPVFGTRTLGRIGPSLRGLR